ncbi:hypothetical protein BDP27DRAFT_1213009 [Rhodocollybia butyracea]|uniref:Uncharacterized protein n=1 Tax=Rhodocollybia butyracea TaxID=206335 RepID=A0A9P5UDM7_9AGAR|nr:hypothetical protein BDP27DRAFT_1213009 [Rhodocollybia butyracea]
MSASVSGVLSALPSPTNSSAFIQPNEASNSNSSSSAAQIIEEPSFSAIQSLRNDPPSPPPSVDPMTSLELRLRLLESLLVGFDVNSGQKGKGKLELLGPEKNETLFKSAETIKRTVDKYVEGNDTLKKFTSHYDQYAQYLTPAFALGLDRPAYEDHLGSTSDLLMYLHDMESDIRSADTDMRDIDELLKRGVLEAGKLPTYVDIEPRLAALVKVEEENRDRADALERRVAGIMENHAVYIDALSELFVAWDDAIIDAENRVAKMERDKEERRRLGLDS